MNEEDREVAEVAAFMKDVAGAMNRKAVPDAHAMWVRMQIAERRRLAERAQRPMRFSWLFAKCWLLGGVGWIVYREWPVIGDLILATPDYVYAALGVAAVIVAKGRMALKR